jgi:DNA-binding NarL/FixJ family response regulator
MVFSYWNRPHVRAEAGLVSASSSGRGMPKRIFARQRVLELRARGLSYRRIARQMGIGEGTVRWVLGSR